MNLEFKKRVITSVFLFVLILFCITINNIIFGITLFFISIKSYEEWCKINYKYFKKKIFNYNLIKIIGLLYILVFFISSLSLRGNENSSIILFITILLVCFCSDIGGYSFGKIIGGKKLTKISPNKTISGSFGSFLFSLIPIILLNLNNNIIFNFKFTLQNILFCLIISFACQTGDLIISYFKRLNKVKNTGNILPGHGGLLDRIDGIIFAVPFVWILIILKVFIYEN